MELPRFKHFKGERYENQPPLTLKDARESILAAVAVLISGYTNFGWDYEKIYEHGKKQIVEYINSSPEQEVGMCNEFRVPGGSERICRVSNDPKQLVVRITSPVPVQQLPKCDMYGRSDDGNPVCVLPNDPHEVIIQAPNEKQARDLAAGKDVIFDEPRTKKHSSAEGDQSAQEDAEAS